MTTLRLLLVRVGLWLAGLGGWVAPVCEAPHLPVDDLVTHARHVVADVAERFADAPPDVKRREALRVLLNTTPGRERDLNLLIELALQ